MIVLVDLDGVLNRLDVTWYARHNRSCQKCTKPLEIENVTTWHTHEYCECGKDIYTYLDSEGIYRNAPAMEDAIYGTLALQEMGHTLYVVTHSYYDSAIIGKSAFMKQHFPHIAQDDIIHTKHKKLIRGDFIIDDCIYNLDGHNGIVPLLFDREHNQRMHFGDREHNLWVKNGVIRVNGWRDIVEKFKEWTQ